MACVPLGLTLLAALTLLSPAAATPVAVDGASGEVYADLVPGSNAFIKLPPVSGVRSLSMWFAPYNDGGFPWEYVLDARPGLEGGHFAFKKFPGLSVGPGWVRLSVNGEELSEMSVFPHVQLATNTSAVWVHVYLEAEGAFSGPISLFSRYEETGFDPAWEQLPAKFSSIQLWDRPLMAEEIRHLADGHESLPFCCATVYQHGWHTGWSATFHPGSYAKAELVAGGGRNDDVSSITVSEGCRATLYGAGDFTGWSATFPAGSYDFDAFTAAGAKNDQASSMVVSAGVVQKFHSQSVTITPAGPSGVVVSQSPADADLLRNAEGEVAFPRAPPTPMPTAAPTLAPGVVACSGSGQDIGEEWDMSRPYLLKMTVKASSYGGAIFAHKPAWNRGIMLHWLTDRDLRLEVFNPNYYQSSVRGYQSATSGWGPGREYDIEIQWDGQYLWWRVDGEIAHRGSQAWTYGNFGTITPTFCRTSEYVYGGDEGWSGLITNLEFLNYKCDWSCYFHNGDGVCHGEGACVSNQGSCGVGSSFCEWGTDCSSCAPPTPPSTDAPTAAPSPAPTYSLSRVGSDQACSTCSPHANHGSQMARCMWSPVLEACLTEDGEHYCWDSAGSWPVPGCWTVPSTTTAAEGSESTPADELLSEQEEAPPSQEAGQSASAAVQVPAPTLLPLFP